MLILVVELRHLLEKDVSPIALSILITTDKEH